MVNLTEHGLINAEGRIIFNASSVCFSVPNLATFYCYQVKEKLNCISPRFKIDTRGKFI